MQVMFYKILNTHVYYSESMTADMEQNGVPRKRLKFRSYKPVDEDLKGKQVNP